MYRDIIITGNVGEIGALKLAAENKDRMKERFPGHILKETGLCGGIYVTERDITDMCINSGCAAKNVLITEVGDRGLVAALWTFGEKIRSGFSINAEKIPVSQLTVEICEMFGVDPFKTGSAGCFLICTDKGNELCEILRKNNVQAVVTGHSVPGKGKVMIMGDVTRYIDKPRG